MPSAYRADIIGSLLRPAYLKEARARHRAGAIGDVELYGFPLGRRGELAHKIHGSGTASVGCPAKT